MRPLPHPPEEEFRLETIFYALSDPARMEIVRVLLTFGDELSCGLLGDGAPKSTLSHHLKVLREAGVTHTRVAGRHRYVSVRTDALDRRFPHLLDVIRHAETPSVVTDAVGRTEP
jgi:DNA-binding transcriptional ArsR family regulator